MTFVPKVPKGEGHSGVVEIVAGRGRDAGCLIRTVSGWTIAGAKDRTTLSKVNLYMLDARTLDTVLDTILRG